MVREPLTEPATAGAKVASKVTDCPAGMVTGTAVPRTLKPAPRTVSAERLISLWPGFWTVMACVLLPLTRTFPYLRLLLLRDSCEEPPDPPVSFTGPEWPPCEVVAESVPETVPAAELRKAT